MFTVKAKMVEKLKFFYISLDQVKNKFVHFGGLKNVLQIKFRFFLAIVLEVKGRYLQLKKLLIFNVICYFESESFFWIGLLKIYLIGGIVPVFENRKKFYITPSYPTV